MNITLARDILLQLARFGVRDYAVCAGARNAPFVKVLAQAKGVNFYSFFDERAAGFFALGRAKRDQRPVAVITTSGTAVAELLPSVVEAHYAGVPIVLISADRPKRFRGSGAPQSIEQVGLFSVYAKKQFDLERPGEAEAVELDPIGPTHINVCFDEPVIDEKIIETQLSPTWPVPTPQQYRELVGDSFDKTLFKKPLVVVSGLSQDEQHAVKEVLPHMGAPFILESASGLRECQELNSHVLRSGAELVTASFFKQHFDSIIRIGSVPTIRLWRDLDGELSKVPVLSVSSSVFSGLAREKAKPMSIAKWVNEFKDFTCVHNEAVFAADTKMQEQKETALQRYANSEPAFFRWLSECIPQNAQVFLGNSLPIREWDLAATYKDKKIHIVTQRGANGIDGLVSTFLGQAHDKVENWLLLGDLSALYDLNALAVTPFASSTQLRIVVVNNRGGQIFSRMFKDKNFLNEHEFEFSKWAEMFGWAYQKVNTQVDLKLDARPTLIEIVVDNGQTQKFWELYEGSVT